MDGVFAKRVYVEQLESQDPEERKEALIARLMAVDDYLQGAAATADVLIVGVNGSGKTTTIGKLARRLENNNRKVLIAAGDTFRAAAIDQLKVWGGRVGAAPT